MQFLSPQGTPQQTSVQYIQLLKPVMMMPTNSYDSENSIYEPNHEEPFESSRIPKPFEAPKVHKPLEQSAIEQFYQQHKPLKTYSTVNEPSNSYLPLDEPSNSFLPVDESLKSYLAVDEPINSYDPVEAVTSYELIRTSEAVKTLQNFQPSYHQPMPLTRPFELSKTVIPSEPYPKMQSYQVAQSYQPQSVSAPIVVQTTPRTILVPQYVQPPPNHQNRQPFYEQQSLFGSIASQISAFLPFDTPHIPPNHIQRPTFDPNQRPTFDPNQRPSYDRPSFDQNKRPAQERPAFDQNSRPSHNRPAPEQNQRFVGNQPRPSHPIIGLNTNEYLPSASSISTAVLLPRSSMSSVMSSVLSPYAYKPQKYHHLAQRA